MNMKAHIDGRLPDEQWGNSAPLTDAEQHNLDTIARVVPCWNRHDVAAILDHYDDEIIWHNMASQETLRGKARVGSYLANLFRGVPDLTMTITMRVARGAFVAEEYTLSGTHLGILFGIPPTGRRLEIHAVSFVEMRDGRFKEDHFYFDNTGVLRQMGLFPPLTMAETTLGHAFFGLAVFLRSPRRALRLRRDVRREGSPGR